MAAGRPPQSVRRWVDSQGTVLASQDYDAFGNIITTSGPTVGPFGFTGREWDDESGWYYYRNRYYDASIGRFISADPTGYNGLDENLYRYVVNDPVNVVDPTGLYGEEVRFQEDYATYKQMTGVFDQRE